MKITRIRTSPALLLLFVGVWINTWITFSRLPLPSALSLWAFLSAPLILLLRLGFVTLILQTLILLREWLISFRELFRIVTLAFYPVYLGSLLHLLWNSSRPVMPLSLAHLTASAGIGEEIQMLLNQFSLFELGWCVMVVKGLSQAAPMGRPEAARLTVWTWSLLAMGQWALYLYVQRGF